MLDKLSKNLNLLSMLDKIELQETEYVYRIWLKQPEEEEYQIFVNIDKKSKQITYEISNVTNTADYSIIINMEDLKELQLIVKTLTEE